MDRVGHLCSSRWSAPDYPDAAVLRHRRASSPRTRGRIAACPSTGTGSPSFVNHGLERIGTDGRSETALERCDRNLVELLQEVRVAQTGVQILFAFLLTVPFTARFAVLTTFQEVLYFGALLAAGVAALLLIAPTSYHRIVFRLGDKENLVRAANRLTIYGLAFVALAMVGVICLISDVLFPGPVAIVTTGTAATVCVTSWYAVPLRRRRYLQRQADPPGPRPLPDSVPVLDKAV